MSSAARTRTVRLWSLAAMAAIAAVVGAVLIPISAEAGTVAVSGVVTGPDGNPMSGVSVSIVDINAGLSAVGAPVVSSASGSFAFPSVPLAHYTIYFAPTATTFGQYLGAGLSDLNFESLDLTDGGGNQAYVDATLFASGTLSGKVTKLPSGALASYTIRAYRRASDGSWTIARTGTTSSNGSYTITGLEPDSYRLEALDTVNSHPTHSPTYSGGATTFSSAASVGITASNTSTYDFAVGKAGSVSGTVSGLSGATSNKLAGVKVTAYRLTGSAPNFTAATVLASPTATTGATGAYSIAGLVPGDYTLEFDPKSATPTATSGYGRTFLGNKDTALGATVLHVGSGTTLTSKNIQLVAGSVITGEVADGNLWPGTDDPLSDIRVKLDYVGGDADDPNENVQEVVTDPSGTFTFTNVGPGNYDLWVGSGDADGEASNGQIRVIAPLANGPITAGHDDFERVLSFDRDAGGLTLSTTPTIDTTDGIGVGDQVLIHTPDWSVSDGGPITTSYQWMRDGKAILGATSPAYTLRPGDVDQDITVAITGNCFGYGTSAPIEPAAIQPTIGTQTIGSPDAQITGDLQVGQTLAADPGYWSASGTVFNYTWQDASSPTGPWNNILLNGYDQTYTIVPNDLSNPYLRVEVYGQKTGYNEAQTVAYASTAVTLGSIDVTTAPTVTKSATAYSVSAGTWSPSSYDSSTTIWTVHNPNGTNTDYSQPTLPLTTAGTNYVSVAIGHTKSGYVSGNTGALLAQTGLIPTATGSTAVTVTGAARVGAPLGAPTPTWTPASGTSSWQWQYKSGSSWKNLAGTASSYTPTATDKGRTLRVVITSTTTGYPKATFTSAASAPIATGDAPAYQSGAVVSGTRATGQTLTAMPGTWLPAPTGFTYQWWYQPAGGTTLLKAPGGTHATFTIPQSMLGADLEVNVAILLTGHASNSESFDLGTIAGGHLSAIKAPKVTHVGNLYTASGATFSPAATGGVVYQWYSYNHSDSPSIAFTGPTATLDPTLHYSVIAIGSRTAYTDSSGPQTLAKLGTFTPSGAITLSGSQVGSPITPSTITWLVNSPTLGYQWQYQSGTSWKSISGATGATYAPAVTYLGKNVRVAVTAKRTNYTPLTVDSTSTVVTESTLQPGIVPDAPGIDGGISTGSTLTALPGKWNASGITFHYKWESSPDQSTWTDTGVTTSTFVIPVAAYHTDYFRVTFSATKANYLPGTATASTPYPPEKGSFVRKVTPTISTVGGTFVATSGSWTPTPSSYDYDWEVYDPSNDNSTPVSTTSTYTPVASDAGKLIEVTVYPNLAAYNSGGIVLVAQTGSPITATNQPTITGNMIVGGTLTANWNPASDFSTYYPSIHAQWYRNGAAISGQVNSTYTLATADYGKTITLKLTLSKDGYGSGTITLNAGTIYNPVLPTATTAPAVTGTGYVDDTLTATSGTWNVAGLAFAYQWTRDGSPIPGATAHSYIVTSLDVAAEVGVTVTATKATFETVSASSQTTTVLVGVPLVPSSTIVITGTDDLGSQLGLSDVTWNYPLTVSYQWEWRASASATWSLITGAISNVYTPTAADGLQSGYQVRVLVDGYRPGHSSYFVTTAAVTLQ